MTKQIITIRVKFFNLRKPYEVLSNFQTFDVNVMISVTVLVHLENRPIKEPTRL
jgi:hypothetical protein